MRPVRRTRGVVVVGLLVSLGVDAQPGPRMPPAASPEPGTVAVTLLDVVQKAVASNWEVENARRELHARTAAAEAALEPFAMRLESDVGYRGSFEPAIGLYSFYYPDPIIRSHRGTATVGISDQLSFGTRFSVRAGLSLRTTDQPGVLVNPTYQLPVEVEVSQPLLRGLGLANARELQVARVRKSQGPQEFNRVRNAVLLATAVSYVNLQAAEALVTSREKTLSLAVSLAEATRRLIANGRLPPTAVHAQAVLVSQRRQDLDAALVGRERARAQLSQLLGTPGVLYRPVDQLRPPVPVWSSEQAARLAASQNPEVLAERRELELRDIDVSVRQNQALPDLRIRFLGGVEGHSGISQCQSGYSADGLFPCDVPPALSGGVGVAAFNLGAVRYGYVEGRVTFQMNLDNEPAQKAVETARLGRENSARRLKQLSDAAHNRAVESVRILAMTERMVGEAQESIKSAERALETTQEAFLLGRATLTDLVRQEEVLALARDREVGAIQSLAVERLRLLEVTGTIDGELLGTKRDEP